MKRISKSFTRALTLALIVLFASSTAYPRTYDAKRLHIPTGRSSATAKGFVGGESHDSYVLRANAGQRMMVQVTSRGNHAGFSISRTDFGEPVNFGKESRHGTRWVGTLPESGDYYISVTAHPDSRYILRVTIL
jgi:hypothetical protein